MKHLSVKEIINTDLYPIFDLNCKRGLEVIEYTRNQLSADGACTLRQFIREDALEIMASQAAEIANMAYRGPTEVTPYFFNYELGASLNLPDQHPLRRKSPRRLSQVAADLFPESGLLYKLFHHSVLPNLLSHVIDQPVYHNKDRFQSLNLSVMEEEGCQQWHFDSGNMVTTLLLQTPEGGGVFEYVPNIRSDQDENFDAVQKVMDGDKTNVLSIKPEAGALNLFKGHYSLHRVTPVIGKRRRLQTILGYTTTPNMQGNTQSSVLHYGPRVANIIDEEKLQA
jgi:hypothetical protein